MSYYDEVSEAKRSLENVSLLTRDEVKTTNRALAKLKSAQPLSPAEEATCAKVIHLSEAIFCD